ncbi:class I SAM-dependent methyltransferase [bacterium]|nr:class I SAM-dependent methyltransferase [bacterium]
MASLRDRLAYLRYAWVKRSFRFWERHGVHVVPVHFYEPIPDTRLLDPALWEQTRTLPAIDLRVDAQLQRLRDFADRYRSEYERFPRQATADPTQYHEENGQFASTDAEVLHCLVRDHRPRLVIEVGSGFSTLITAAALRRNAAEGAPGELVCIEPYPNATLRAGVPGVTRLISTPLQQVPLETFAQLAAGDVLFIDSSHVVAIGSDTTREVLDIVPRLAPGVLVHFHDIYTPLEYPRNWVLDEHRFWNEQYLVEAFLSFNERFEILYAGSYLHVLHPDALVAFSSLYRPQGRWSTSLWIRRVS